MHWERQAEAGCNLNVRRILSENDDAFRLEARSGAAICADSLHVVVLLCHGRHNGPTDQASLSPPKQLVIGSVDSQIKAMIEHKEYGRALMIHWKDWHDPKNRLAMTVRYNPRKAKNELDAVFRCESMPTY